MPQLFRQLMAENFAPHAWCLRETGVVAVHAVSDILIAFAYVLIPSALMLFFRRRRDVKFSWFFILFGFFILSCGLTHFLAAWTLWHPIYRLEALVKAVTATASLLTAAALWIAFPKLMALPSPALLEAEVKDRAAAETKVRLLNAQLERKVADRTAALTAANSQLSVMEERLRLALDLAALGIWDEDLETGAIFENQQCRSAFGFLEDRPHLLEEHLGSVHPEDIGRLRTLIANAREPQRGGQYSAELRAFGADDKVLRSLQEKGWVLFKDTPAGRVPARFIRTTLDVTERRRIELSLLRSNADLRQFAFAAAHDLQEPLRNISVSIELLALKHSSLWDDEARELIACSVEGAQRVHNMVQDLLAYTSVIDAPDDGGHCCNSAKALSRALGNLQSRINESGAEVSYGQLPTLPVSDIHLLQLFQNLIGNAIKYRTPGLKPEIRISASLGQQGWLFKVTDNGIGFHPSYAERIFGVFKRLHNRESYPGNGIGLAICSRIVSHYNGKIWAESQPGRGATFYFLLPA